MTNRPLTSNQKVFMELLQDCRSTLENSGWDHHLELAKRIAAYQSLPALSGDSSAPTEAMQPNDWIVKLTEAASILDASGAHSYATEVREAAVALGRSAPETKPDDLLWDTIAQNTRLATALRHVTESWCNGRRVLDGIGETAAKLAREAFEVMPDRRTVEDIKIGAGIFKAGIPLRIVLERIERGYDYAARGLVPPAQETGGDDFARRSGNSGANTTPVTSAPSAAAPLAAPPSDQGGEAATVGAGSKVHTVEDDFQHWLSYSGHRGENETCLRAAYYAGAGAENGLANGTISNRGESK